VSIKALHIILISCAILVSVVFGVWAFGYARTSGDSAYQTGGVLSIALAVGLLFYLVQFVRKAKKLS
jgi:multisubunit Na+/H+ antiporter MnhG subunit